MTSRVLWTAAAAGGLLAASLYAADKEEQKIHLKDVKCLIMTGKDVKAEASVDHQGGKIFFCCNNCKAKYTKAPEQYAAKANAQLVATKQAKQVKCPLSGKDVNAEVTAKVSGLDVAFCCAGCQGKVLKAEGDAAVNVVFNEEAFKKGFKLTAVKKKKEATN